MLANAFTYNKRICELTKAGQGKEGLRLYREMREDGVIPNDHTFTAVLKACSAIADLEAGRSIHGHVSGSGKAHIFVANSLIDMYAKCGSIEDARHVFDSMKQRDVVSWNAMIIGYAHMKMGDLALQLYARMPQEGFQRDDRTIVAALKACAGLASQQECKGAHGDATRASCLEQGRAIHAEAAERGHDSDMFVGSALVDMYVKCGSIQDACSVFEKMPHRDVVSWNSMIIGCAQMDKGELALKLFAHMRRMGCAPNSRTLVAASNACASLAAQDEGKGTDDRFFKAKYLQQGRAIHAEAVRRGLDSNIFLANSLLDMYAKCGSIDDARQVFEKMKHRDVVSWNAMITGYAQMEMGDLALELYTCMQKEDFQPDAHTFVGALKACASLATRDQDKGTDGALLKSIYLQQGRSIHADVAKGGFESNVFVASTLVDMYAKCGSIEDARQVFENMTYRNVVSWNAIIKAYAQMEMGNSALELFTRMQHEGFTPNAHTFAGVLQACRGLVSMETGKEIYSQIEKAGLQGDSFLANCLIDMYGKCGSMRDAQQLFDSLLVRDSVTWNALIAGYSGQGDSESVFDLYKRMQQDGIKPSSITFLSVLNVCSHNGLVEKGQIYFQAMCSEYGILPSCYHYTSLTDLLGRAGQLDEAAAMMMKMPFEPDMITWKTILGACQKWNNVEAGKNTFECAVMVDENSAAAHVLMTNIYFFSDRKEES